MPDFINRSLILSNQFKRVLQFLVSVLKTYTCIVLMTNISEKCATLGFKFDLKIYEKTYLSHAKTSLNSEISWKKRLIDDTWLVYLNSVIYVHVPAQVGMDVHKWVVIFNLGQHGWGNSKEYSKFALLMTVIYIM